MGALLTEPAAREAAGCRPWRRALPWASANLPRCALGRHVEGSPEEASPVVREGLRESHDRGPWVALDRKVASRRRRVRSGALSPTAQRRPVPETAQ